MKAYIGNHDWADEGDVFFFSLETEEILQAMKKLMQILSEVDVNFSAEMYWGSNESFDFYTSDLIEFIDEAVDISEEEINVFKKFNVSGFDIYDRIRDHIGDVLTDEDIQLTERDLNALQPAYITLFGEEDWDIFKGEVTIISEEE